VGFIFKHPSAEMLGLWEMMLVKFVFLPNVQQQSSVFNEFLCLLRRDFSNARAGFVCESNKVFRMGGHEKRKGFYLAK